MRLRPYLLALLALAVFTSCSIQRRNYRSGFYIDWKNSTAHKETVRKEKQQEIVGNPSPVSEVLLGTNTAPKNITASLVEKEVRPAFTGIKTFIDNCDTIIFRDGTEILAKVIEVGTTEIKYKNCDNLNGPLYVADKNKVNFIVYSNGQVDQFKVEQQVNIQNKYSENELSDSDYKARGMGKVSMIYGIVGLGSLTFYGIGGIIMGIAALLKSRKTIEYMGKTRSTDKKALKYALLGKKFGIIALAVGLVILALIVLIIATI